MSKAKMLVLPILNVGYTSKCCFYQNQALLLAEPDQLITDNHASPLTILFHQVIRCQPSVQIHSDFLKLILNR